LEEIVIEVWGDFACFSAPQAKVERLTYPFPTPSAARGILSAIYSKPVEFYWQVNRIEVLNPIQYISFKRNEVKCTVSGKDFVYTEDERTQRQTVALKDVRYRIAASMIPRSDFQGNEKGLYRQAMCRIQNGKCYFQPSFGIREFAAYFEEYQPSPDEKQPVSDTLDAGLMVYDIFDFVHDIKVQKKTKPVLSLFHAVMEQGVIQVPPYESPEVLKGASIC
jgi:CRISPR-associated protein Cas5d